MKKGAIIAIAVTLAIVLLAGAAFVFRDELLDALPIDQSGWETEGGVIRYLNEDGDAVTGWLELEGQRYHFGANGEMTTGWLTDGGKNYYFSANGTLSTGWLELDGQTYYLDEDGSAHIGWLTLGSDRYYLDNQGCRLTGWADLGGQPYHFGTNGAMTVGWLDTEDGRYFFTGEGLRYSGWLTDSTGTYYLDENGLVSSGWLNLGELRYYLDENGLLQTGWVEADGLRYYLNADGTAATGWQDVDDHKYYFNDDGSVHTGWLETDNATYYLLDDGSAAVGKQEIDGEVYYFTSTGANILLVNRWNTLSADYVPELVISQSGVQMVPEAADALDLMVAACKEAGYKPKVRTAYRDYAWQQQLFKDKCKEYPYEQAAQIVAIPGTSEHQTGLAVDISDSTYTLLNRKQGDTEIQKWLWEHCWEYGFIVRYPDDTTDITGIIYESWHYRYVGVELAMEMKENGLCLEEYLDQLTGDGSTCGNPDR